MRRAAARRPCTPRIRAGQHELCGAVRRGRAQIAIRGHHGTWRLAIGIRVPAGEAQRGRDPDHAPRVFDDIVDARGRQPVRRVDTHPRAATEAMQAVSAGGPDAAVAPGVQLAHGLEAPRRDGPPPSGRPLVNRVAIAGPHHPGRIFEEREDADSRIACAAARIAAAPGSHSRRPAANPTSSVPPESSTASRGLDMGQEAWNSQRVVTVTPS